MLNKKILQWINSDFRTVEDFMAAMELMTEKMKEMNYLDCCENAPAPMPCYPVACNKKQENNMGYNNITVTNAISTETQDQRNYLVNRLESTYSEGLNAAAETFHLIDDPAPRTGKDLLARIADGMYVYDEAAEKNYVRYGYGPTAFIKWRNPKTPADQEGYDAFRVKYDDAWQNALDEIKIKSPEAGLAALKAFEDYTVN